MRRLARRSRLFRALPPWPNDSSGDRGRRKVRPQVPPSWLDRVIAQGFGPNQRGGSAWPCLRAQPADEVTAAVFDRTLRELREAEEPGRRGEHRPRCAVLHLEGDAGAVGEADAE